MTMLGSGIGEWRDWRLAWYSTDHYTGRKRPPAQPPDEAELSGDGAWASLYVDKTLVASWLRHRLPDREHFAALAKRRREREAAARLDADRTVG